MAFIGSHGVGKTTLCYGLAAELKARDIALEIVHEVARRCPLPINEQTSIEAQSWILHTQVAEELVAAFRYPAVICDRSILDNYVYLLLSSGPLDTLEPLVKHWMASYDLLVHVPVIEKPSPDGVRATDPSFQLAVDERLRRELSERRLECLRLEPGERRSWLTLVAGEVVSRIGAARAEPALS